MVVLGVICERRLPFRLPWGIDVALFAIVFYYVGYSIYDLVAKILKENTLNVKVCWSVIALIINIATCSINGECGMASVQYGNEMLFLISAFSGIIVVLLVSSIVKQNKILEFFGKRSLIIMCISEPIRRITIKLVSIATAICVDELRNGIFTSIALYIHRFYLNDSLYNCY